MSPSYNTIKIKQVNDYRIVSNLIKEIKSFWVCETCGEWSEEYFKDESDAQMSGTKHNCNNRRMYAQQVANLFYWVATHPDKDIARCDSETYINTKSLLIKAIWFAYPSLSKEDVDKVYTMFIDCNESIQYCVNHKDEVNENDVIIAT